MNRSEILAKRLLENEPEPPLPPEQEPASPTPKTSQPLDVKGEINKLLPIQQYRFKGSGVWNATGMINLAVRNFTLKLGRNEEKWSINMLRAMNAPEHVIDALIHDRATVEPDGNDAIVTVKLYGDIPRNRKKHKQTPPRQ